MTDFSQNRILIVDDAPENIDILTGILKDYKKSVALNGEKALKIAFSKNKPDLILLDIIMPNMDGFEVCRRLKEDSSTKDIPVIFLTGKSDTESIVKGFELGAVDYVTKPFNSSELLVRVNTQMTLKKSKDEIENYVIEIEQKNEQITNSINYASRIQTAVLPKESFFDTVFDDYFILFKPKDIVSGDFYWTAKIETKIIIIVADCTGHGVPGAFMSMFGIASLNEIIKRKKITSPSKILDELRKMIIQSLDQNSEGKLKDGMDMAVITIDTKTNVLEYAGAQNPMYFVRDNELNQIKSDRMPVAIHARMDDFKSHEMELKPNDQIYIFTDGYVDQFGGPKEKKFMYPPFRKLLLDNSSKPMSEQKKALEDSFNTWKGDFNQIDDVSIIGIKV